MRSGPVALTLMLTLAGCLGGAKSVEVTSTTTAAPALGSVFGTVLDDEARPLEGVNVTLVEEGQTTGTRGDGYYAFTSVPAGDHTLVFADERYETVTKSVQIAPDQGVRTDASLAKLPEFRPHNLTVVLHGNFDCAAEYLIITGHCGIIVTNVTCTAGHCTDDPVFTQKYEFRFEVLPHWETLIAELQWSQSPSNLLDGMRLYVENLNGTGEAGHSIKVGRVEGNQQPLAIRIDRGHPRPDADLYPGTGVKAFIPDQGGQELVRVFPKGLLAEETGQVCSGGRCFLGVGAGFNINFDVYLTLFYNEVAPAGFTSTNQTL